MVTLLDMNGMFITIIIMLSPKDSPVSVCNSLEHRAVDHREPHAHLGCLHEPVLGGEVGGGVPGGDKIGILERYLMTMLDDE